MIWIEDFGASSSNSERLIVRPARGTDSSHALALKSQTHASTSIVYAPASVLEYCTSRKDEPVSGSDPSDTLRILRGPTLPEFRDGDAERRRRGEEIAPFPTHTRATDERHAIVIARYDAERPHLTRGGHPVETGPDRDGRLGGVNPSARFHHSRRRVNQRRVPKRDDDPHAPQLSLRGHDVAALGVD